jgi:hypothetical protein
MTLNNTNEYKSQAEAGGQLLAFEPLLQMHLWIRVLSSNDQHAHEECRYAPILIIQLITEYIIKLTLVLIFVFVYLLI